MGQPKDPNLLQMKHQHLAQLHGRDQHAVCILTNPQDRTLSCPSCSTFEETGSCYGSTLSDAGRNRKNKGVSMRTGHRLFANAVTPISEQKLPV